MKPPAPLVRQEWLRADPTVLATASATAVAAAEALRHAGGQLVSATPTRWQGQSQRAEQALTTQLQALLETLALIVTILGRELGRLAAEVTSAQQQWWQALHAQRAYEAYPGSTGGLPSQLALAATVRAVEAAQGLHMSDQRAAAAIAALPWWRPPMPVGRAGGSAQPAAIARWWAGLLPSVQTSLLGRPGWSGAGEPASVLPTAKGPPVALWAADGVPEQVRDEINRRLLVGALRRDPHSAGLMSLRAALAAPGPRELLLFDPAGDGRAVVAVGPLATAAHLVVLVPGMTTTLADIDRLVTQANTVLAAARPQDSLAAVAWLGYDAPNLLQVVSAAAARSGAASLAAFVAGLRVLHPGAGITLVGHSYGSLVVGLAARRGLAADELVFVGAPGVGARSARRLAPAGRVWAAQAPGDPISALFRVSTPVGVFGVGATGFDLAGPVYRYGPDPASPRFGATVFRTGPGVSGHSDYFKPDSESARNIERIAVGDTSEVTVRP